MNRKWFSIIALIAIATFFLSLSSCGFNQHLVSIQVVPPGGDIRLSRIERCLQGHGTYEHPPADQGHYRYRNVVGRLAESGFDHRHEFGYCSQSSAAAGTCMRVITTAPTKSPAVRSLLGAAPALRLATRLS